MQWKPISELEQVSVLGRTTGRRDPVALFWTASGLEVQTTVSELWLECETGYDAHEVWISVELNGAWIARQMLAKGASSVCLYRGLCAGTPRRVRVLKDTQAMSDDPAHYFLIRALGWEGGELLPAAPRGLMLEFVGDSITSGEGALGALCETDWVMAFFSAENNYAMMTAKALDADIRIVSQSGWGIVTSWDNDPRRALMDSYERVCGVVAGERNKELGAHEPYDFAQRPADAVIVNLGTNDCGACQQPAREIDGKPFQLRKDESGRFDADTDRLLRQGIRRALDKLRACNPSAKLVWAYGMLGSDMEPLLRQCIDDYRARTGDTQVWFCPLPDTTPDTVGARSHPGVASHRAAADALVRFLRESVL